MNRLELAEALIAIADCGSIYQAAEKLHQTDAAISKKLSKLEAHLGVQLINRDRKGLSLTDVGQHYYHDAKKALAQFLAAEQAISQTKIKPQGELRVTSNQYFAKSIILPKLSAFMGHYPDLKISLDVAEVLPDFNAKKMDILFGVSFSVPGEDHLVQKQLVTTQYVLCASPHYLKYKGTPHAPSELLKHDYISHSGRKNKDLITLDHHQEILLIPTLTLNNSQLSVEAALLNLGFIWTHKYFITELLEKKKLVCFLEKFTQQTYPVYVFYEYQRYRDPKIKAFMDFFS